MEDTRTPRIDSVAFGLVYSALIVAATILVVVCLPIFLWHSVETYRYIHDAVLAEHQQTLDLLGSFCVTEQRRSTAVCMDALSDSRRNVRYEVMERFISENLSHLPLVHYCRHHDTCRDMFLLTADTLRTSLSWVILALVPIALVCLYFWATAVGPGIASSLTDAGRWQAKARQGALPHKYE